MKKNIIIIVFILLSGTAFSQTIIPATTTIHDFSLMKNGQYRIISPTDTLDVTKDTALIITKIVTVTIHDTIPRICPVCPVCPTQRSMIGISYNPVTNQWITTYNDNSTSIFTPTKTLFIQ